MVKSVVVDPAHTWRHEPRPKTPWEDTIIYEAHVKGLTQQRDDVPAVHRAALYRGLSRARHDRASAQARRHRHRAPAGARLPRRARADRPRPDAITGATTRSASSRRRRATPAPMPSTTSAPPSPRCTTPASRSSSTWSITTPPRATIWARRCATAASTTLLIIGCMHDQPRYYENFTGTGNALKLTHPRVLQMVMDSLRLWVEAFHVDGFRFDLAPTLGRGPAFDRNAPFFAAIRQDPVLCNVKLIAEPWDIGTGGYQVGGFPTGWSEWNDFYRHTARRFWRGDDNLIGDLAHCMTGSSAQFQHDGRSPRASINHVTAHDGFTLADLVSYERKHNRGQRRGQPRRHRRQSQHQLRRRGRDRRRRRARHAPAAAAQSARLPVPGAGRADAAGRRRSRQRPERQQQRLLPGQRDRLGRLVEARQRGRSHRLRRRAEPAAPRLSATAAAPLAAKARRPTAPTT